jgi:hypothetical protein
MFKTDKVLISGIHEKFLQIIEKMENHTRKKGESTGISYLYKRKYKRFGKAAQTHWLLEKQK